MVRAPDPQLDVRPLAGGRLMFSRRESQLVSAPADLKKLVDDAGKKLGEMDQQLATHATRLKQISANDVDSMDAAFCAFDKLKVERDRQEREFNKLNAQLEKAKRGTR